VFNSSVTVPKVKNIKVARRRPSDGTDSEKERKMKKRPPPKKTITTAEPMETTGPSGSTFAPLSDHEDTDIQKEDSMGEEEETSPAEESDEKPPPIVLHGKYDHKKLLDLSAQSTENGVSRKFTRENTIIYARTIKDFNALKESLKKSSKAEWHTYATKKEKTHGFVAYGLDNNPAQEDIKKDLEKKGINCRTPPYT
jgi:pyruvate/2-oxoacid:ferredoxin oxidoreductase alpha subunit